MLINTLVLFSVETRTTNYIPNLIEFTYLVESREKLREIAAQLKKYLNLKDGYRKGSGLNNVPHRDQ